MSDEFKQQLVDYFDAWELVEFLQVSVEDVVAAFHDEIEDCAEELQELMDIGVRNR
jgi:hypothetical protein